MKARLYQLASIYLLSTWLPATVVVCLAGLLWLNELKLHLPYGGYLFLIGIPLGMLGILIAAIVQFVKGLKTRGVISLLLLVTAVVVLGMFASLMFAAMFNEEPDNFGKNIVIPPGMQASNPLEDFAEPGEPVADSLTAKIVAAFSASNNNSNAQISTDLAALNEFATTNQQKLIQHLAASPRWFVTEEFGRPYAYRRLCVGGRWKNSLNGFYGSFDFDSSSHFQTRIVIGFDGPVFDGPFRKVLTTAPVGLGVVQAKVVEDTRNHQGKESYFVLQSSRATVEIFEQSGSDGRPATQLALAEIKSELEAALNPTNMMPLGTQGASATNEAAIQLAKGMQGGIYQVRAFVNPGEAGRVYLKAFEATQNTALSTDRLRPRSTARVGWSTNAVETFRYQSEITIYEGDWGTFYPARFELWFMPDSGAAERKLIDRIFRIEGWMR